MGTKYIKNTDDATIICKIPSDKTKVFVFRKKQFDKRNNILISNGFTEISDEDMTLLEKESNTFKYYMNNGKLSIADSLPQDAMSSDQLIASLRAEIAALKRQSAGGDSSAEVEQLKQEIIALEEKHLKEVEEMQNMIDELTSQLAEETVVEDGDKEDEHNQSVNS